MVRFIIRDGFYFNEIMSKFTFQYGQIYYNKKINERREFFLIYIPIWLDLLCILLRDMSQMLANLHSNMVRFIIKKESKNMTGESVFTFQYGQIYYAGIRDDEFLAAHIYIPIWLDLLFSELQAKRFSSTLFTFQYGQIYYI